MESVLRPFVITSERVGSLVFQKDIDGTTLTIKDKIEELLEATDSHEVEGFYEKYQVSLSDIGPT